MPNVIVDESFIHFACEGRRLCLLERGGRGRAVPEPDGRQEHVQGLRGRRHPGRLRA